MWICTDFTQRTALKKINFEERKKKRYIYMHTNACICDDLYGYIGIGMYA